MNTVEIEEAISKLAEQPFDPATFPYALPEVFGNKTIIINRLESGNTKKTDIECALLQYNNIHLVVCSADEINKWIIKQEINHA